MVANAWDADARHVWVTVPFGESWTTAGEIVVLDDGHGMTRDQAQDNYLIAGRKRRIIQGDQTDGGRMVHGRKGIGKLAAFGTAKILDCYTVREGQMIDASYIKVHPHGAGARGGNQAMARTKGG